MENTILTDEKSDERREYFKRYYQRNKERMKRQVTEKKFVCELCGSVTIACNRRRHLGNMKHRLRVYERDVRLNVNATNYTQIEN